MTMTAKKLRNIFTAAIGIDRDEIERQVQRALTDDEWVMIRDNPLKGFLKSSDEIKHGFAAAMEARISR